MNTLKNASAVVTARRIAVTLGVGPLALSMVVLSGCCSSTDHKGSKPLALPTAPIRPTSQGVGGIGNGTFKGAKGKIDIYITCSGGGNVSVSDGKEKLATFMCVDNGYEVTNASTKSSEIFP